MFQFAFPAALFKFSARKPSFRALLQLPNRSETETGKGRSARHYIVYFLFLGEGPQTPFTAPTSQQALGEVWRPRRPRTRSRRRRPSPARESHRPGRRRNGRTEAKPL